MCRLLILGVGWWWWRAPVSPTVRLLYLAAHDWVYLIYYCWPGSRWVSDLTWAGKLVEPLVVVIVRRWPTGRPGRRVVRIGGLLSP